KRRQEDLDYLKYCADTHRHYVASHLLVRDLHQYDAKGKSADTLALDRNRFVTRIKAVRDETARLRDTYRELWLRTNIPPNLNYVMDDYDRLVKVWEDAHERASRGVFAYDPRPPAQWIYHPQAFAGKKPVQHAFFRRSIKLNEPVQRAGIQL